VTFAEETSPIFTQATMAGRVRMILAGRAAERIVCGDVSGGAGGNDGSDLAQATALVAAMRGSYGLRETLRWTGPPGEASNALAFDLDFRRAVERDLKNYDRQTHAIARRYRDRICALATQLVELRQVDFHRPERSEASDLASSLSGLRTSQNTRRTTTGGRNPPPTPA